jgi:hypothetical protein
MALPKEVDDVAPWDWIFRTARDQFSIVTIAASPWAPLAEDHCRELTWVIEGGHRIEAAYEQLVAVLPGYI